MTYYSDAENNAERDRLNRAFAQAPAGSSKQPGTLGAIRSTAFEEIQNSKKQDARIASRNLPVPTAKNKGLKGTQSGPVIAKALRRRKAKRGHEEAHQRTSGGGSAAVGTNAATGAAGAGG
jgi:hypothetical protein